MSMRRLPFSFSFFFSYSADHRDLHSFPTRRSSDLEMLPRPLPGGTDDAPIDHPITDWPYTRPPTFADRKSTRLNSSHQIISYAVFCLKKKKKKKYYT